MNKKGQALIEFVLILPVLILIVFSIIDFGNIMVLKSNLENKMDNIVDVYKETKDLNSIRSFDSEGLSITINREGNYLNIKLEKGTKIITPGLNKILGSNYKTFVERVVKYE